MYFRIIMKPYEYTGLRAYLSAERSGQKQTITVQKPTSQ